MSLSDVVSSIWRLTPSQRMLIAGFITAAVASATALDDSAVTLIVRATFWFAIAALIERTLEALRGAPVDGRAFVAYLPLVCAAAAWWLAEITAPHVTRSGSLSMFFAVAASLLGALLVSLVVEARRATKRDQWVRALRGWWVGFIVLGILYALLGLAPGHSRKSEGFYYEMVWAGLVGAVAALTIVMWRDSPQHSGSPAPELEPARPQQRIAADVLHSSATSTSTRTPVRSTPAAHQAARH